MHGLVAPAALASPSLAPPALSLTPAPLELPFLITINRTHRSSSDVASVITGTTSHKTTAIIDTTTTIDTTTIIDTRITNCDPALPPPGPPLLASPTRATASQRIRDALARDNRMRG